MIFWSLCFFGATLAQKLNSFICKKKKNQFFFTPEWGHINRGIRLDNNGQGWTTVALDFPAPFLLYPVWRCGGSTISISSKQKIRIILLSIRAIFNKKNEQNILVSKRSAERLANKKQLFWGQSYRHMYWKLTINSQFIFAPQDSVSAIQCCWLVSHNYRAFVCTMCSKIPFLVLHGRSW